MNRSRVVRTLIALGLVAGCALLSPPPAGAEDSSKQTQTISFTSTPPSGEDWVYGSTYGPDWNYGYVARASATSGLPVTYSIAQASADVCTIAGVYQDDPFFGTGAVIEFDGAGTCTIDADQSGDDAYLPAEQVSQSFEIEKAATRLDPVKATKGFPGLAPSTFTATLWTAAIVQRYSPGWTAYADRVVTFSVAGKPVCAATTDRNGHATCTATLGLFAWLTQTGFTATYAGDANYMAATVNRLFGLI
jgi:hypothetical protein